MRRQTKIELFKEAMKFSAAHFHDERLTFLRRDVLVLPVRNVTCEELSAYLLDGIVRDTGYLSEHDIRRITVKVLSGPGQSASAEWTAT